MQSIRRLVVTHMLSVCACVWGVRAWLVGGGCRAPGGQEEGGGGGVILGSLRGTQVGLGLAAFLAGVRSAVYPGRALFGCGLRWCALTASVHVVTA